MAKLKTKTFLNEQNSQMRMLQSNCSINFPACYLLRAETTVTFNTPSITVSVTRIFIHSF